MAESSLPPPRYSLWQAINVALTMGLRALEEVRMLAPEVGKPGPAGLGFDDLEILYDGERSFTFRLARGETVKEWRYSVPVQIYRGVYRDGETYQAGDTVTWASCLWHCKVSTSTKPEDKSSSDWVLAVKRGQDGASAYAVAQKEGFAGTRAEWLSSIRGPRGAEGKPGRDLTQRGPDGAKW